MIKHITLRCYAYQRLDGKIFAECIDLDIAVIRNSIPEAKRELNHAIHGYLQTVVSQGWINDFVPRPSPLISRLRYRFFKILFWLGSTRVQVYHDNEDLKLDNLVPA
jgi:hypothetical protein